MPSTGFLTVFHQRPSRFRPAGAEVGIFVSQALVVFIAPAVRRRTADDPVCGHRSARRQRHQREGCQQRSRRPISLWFRICRSVTPVPGLIPPDSYGVGPVAQNRSTTVPFATDLPGSGFWLFT
jgi:hypothetical protein